MVSGQTQSGRRQWCLIYVQPAMLYIENGDEYIEMIQDIGKTVSKLC